MQLSRLKINFVKIGLNLLGRDLNRGEGVANQMGGQLIEDQMGSKNIVFTFDGPTKICRR